MDRLFGKKKEPEPVVVKPEEPVVPVVPAAPIDFSAHNESLQEKLDSLDAQITKLDNEISTLYKKAKASSPSLQASLK